MGRGGSKADPIIVVMDDGVRRADMLRRLGRAGYSCVVATDGSGALGILGQGAYVPATVLVDSGVKQPVLRALLRTLASIPNFATVQIFVIKRMECADSQRIWIPKI